MRKTRRQLIEEIEQLRHDYDDLIIDTSTQIKSSFDEMCENIDLKLILENNNIDYISELRLIKLKSLDRKELINVAEGYGIETGFNNIYLIKQILEMESRLRTFKWDKEVI